MNSKKIVTALIVGGALMVATAGHARGTATGEITSISSSSRVISVFLDATNVAISGETIPPCATKDDRFTLRPEQKTQIAILLTAYAIGKEVKIRGAGTCDNKSNAEDASIIVLN